MDIFFTTDGLLNLFTLTTLEIILGIDNVIFIAILIHNLPSNKRTHGKFVGLFLALVLRIIMLMGASWITKLTNPFFSIYGFDFSGRNLLLIIGGIFLIGKSILELIELFDDKSFDPVESKSPSHRYWRVIFQIVFIDLILSFDSIITAVGMTNNLPIIITAIFISIIVMMVSSKTIGDFIHKYPTVKIIALCFIALVGIMLVLNGFGIEFSKSYLYMTMFFSIVVEMINILLKRKHDIKQKGYYE
jgi:predicted tellurium resistance membrane protein TerC